MSDSIQTKGKTVNAAVSEALLQLGLRRDEVEIKVIEEPKSGLLGFIGGRPAKVMVRKKPERRRGRGRDNRGRDDQAHSLSGGGRGGRSRGGRGRGGRTNQPDNNQENNRDNNRDGGRGGRSDQGPRQDNNEVRAEARNEAGSQSRDEGRGGSSRGGSSRGGRSRGGRGRGGRDNNRDNRQEARQDNNRQQSEPQESGRSESPRRDTRRQEESQQGGGRDGGSSRRGGRGRGRGGRDDQVTVERSTEKTSRSRRGGGPGRNDQQPKARRDERVVAREENPSAQVAQNVTPEAETRANQTPAAAEVASTPSNPRENTSMANDQTNPTPAAAETPRPETAAPAAVTPEAPTPVAKPKAKRKGWGGGIGSRLPRKANPAVKAKPEPEPVVVAEAAPRTSEPAPRRESGDDDRGRSEYRERRPSAEVDEVIIDAVAATKYARPVADVTEENLDTALAELASGMLARAGFPCEVEVNEGEYRQVRISSDEESAGMLIGRHGQTVDAVEHLVERMACNAIDDRVRMNLDINGYRERRSESLQERVADAIAEVRETGKAYHVEPMSARERRLVHLEAEAAEGIRTFTMIGSGGKYVVIALDDEANDSQQNED